MSKKGDVYQLEIDKIVETYKKKEALIDDKPIIEVEEDK